MSLSRNPQLSHIAKQLCRDLRKRSTNSESIFWGEVRNRKILNKKFYRQYPLFFDLNGKETFFIADFFCFENKLVVEIDGGYHERQKEHDQLRTHIINDLGIEVIRFTNKQVELKLEEVLNNLKNHLKNHKPHAPFSAREGGLGDESRNAAILNNNSKRRSRQHKALHREPARNC